MKTTWLLLLFGILQTVTCFANRNGTNYWPINIYFTVNAGFQGAPQNSTPNLGDREPAPPQLPPPQHPPPQLPPPQHPPPQLPPPQLPPPQLPPPQHPPPQRPQHSTTTAAPPSTSPAPPKPVVPSLPPPTCPPPPSCPTTPEPPTCPTFHNTCPPCVSQTCEECPTARPYVYPTTTPMPNGPTTSPLLLTTTEKIEISTLPPGKNYYEVNETIIDHRDTISGLLLQYPGYMKFLVSTEKQVHKDEKSIFHKVVAVPFFIEKHTADVLADINQLVYPVIQNEIPQGNVTVFNLAIMSILSEYQGIEKVIEELIKKGFGPLEILYVVLRTIKGKKKSTYELSEALKGLREEKSWNRYQIYKRYFDDIYFGIANPLAANYEIQYELKKGVNGETVFQPYAGNEKYDEEIKCVSAKYLNGKLKCVAEPNSPKYEKVRFLLKKDVSDGMEFFEMATHDEIKEAGHHYQLITMKADRSQSFRLVKDGARERRLAFWIEYLPGGRQRLSLDKRIEFRIDGVIETEEEYEQGFYEGNQNFEPMPMDLKGIPYEENGKSSTAGGAAVTPQA